MTWQGGSRRKEMSEQQTVYVTYIAATPERLWAALTQAEFTRQYFFGRAISSDWQAGSEVVYRMPDGVVDVRGRILEIDPPRIVRFTWKVERIEAMRDLPEVVVSYEIEPMGEVCRLTMVEDHPHPVEEKWLEGGRRGWPIILSSLKSLMEIGRVPEIALDHALQAED
jgi:uncharacterized protein YndB with AHSA1/START domain